MCQQTSSCAYTIAQPKHGGTLVVDMNKSPQKKSDQTPEITTGLLASVWQVRQPDEEESATLRLIEIEHKIERARKVLQNIEDQAKDAENRIAHTERKFASLRDSFELLRKDWQDLQDKDNKKS